MPDVKAAVEGEAAQPNTVDVTYGDDLSGDVALARALEYALYAVHLTYLRIAYMHSFTSGY